MENLKLLIIAFSLLLFFSCVKETTNQPANLDESEKIENLNVPDGFDFSTIKEVNVDVTVNNNSGIHLSNVLVKVYSSDPERNYGSEESSGAKVIASGMTNTQGKFKTTLSLASSLKELFFVPEYPGIIQVGSTTINGNSANYTFERIEVSSKKSVRSNNTVEDFNVMGSWDSNGVPDYLDTPDVVEESLMLDINTSLPERDPLPETHPEYLAGDRETNIVLIDSADVWVTFVHEGAGWKNALGYYTYPIGSTEEEIADIVDDITNLTLIFPNSSFAGSGGGLHTGDKVYLGHFQENTVVSWFLVANGWKQSGAYVSTSKYKVFSNSFLNPESSDDLKQHTVLLYDDIRSIFILGIEDIKRNLGRCDHDFNDAVFYATVSPESAVDTTGISDVDSEIEDQDGDGVSDEDDDYPNDPDKAFDNYMPSEDMFSTLAYEDLWPSKGDYDFNDLVLDYNFNQITNADNDLVEIEAKLVIRAVGAGFHNGFGFELPVNPSTIESVDGYRLNDNYINLSANGTESGQSKAVIIAYDDSYDILKHPGAGNGTGVNTTEGVTYVEPNDTIFLNIKFTTPVSIETFLPPYNPFLIKDGDREFEIHLPNFEPTDLANLEHFGTYDDASDALEGIYYKSKSTNLPWAINIPVSFDYPTEKDEILLAYLKFGAWVESDGLMFDNWYEDQDGYRNNEYIYSH